MKSLQFVLTVKQQEKRGRFIVRMSQFYEEFLRRQWNSMLPLLWKETFAERLVPFLVINGTFRFGHKIPRQWLFKSGCSWPSLTEFNKLHFRHREEYNKSNDDFGLGKIAT